MTIDDSDALKLLDALAANEQFHRFRDNMNGAVHLAKETRLSPLTSETIAARERLSTLMREQGVPQ